MLFQQVYKMMQLSVCNAQGVIFNARFLLILRHNYGILSIVAMADIVNFICSCCKSRITNDDRNRHLIEGACIHNIGYKLAWMECAKEELCLPPDKRKWVHTDQVPIIGERRILKVTVPFDDFAAARS